MTGHKVKSDSKMLHNPVRDESHKRLLLDTHFGLIKGASHTWRDVIHC
jgi:hypothetical protein